MANADPINNYGTYTRRGGESSDRRSIATKPAGRYDRRSHNTRISGGLAASPAVDADTVIAAVEDPWGNGKERVLATVNRRVDILEMERSHDRISEAAYRTGRLIQAIFERLGNVSGTNWCGTSRIDPALAQELKIIRSLDSARKIEELAERIRSRIGMIDMRLLKRLLGDRLTFAECANLQGKSGERGQTYIAARFREALEDLAEAWTGKGKAIPAPDDKHTAAEKTMATRQATSVKAGVSARRRKLESAN